MAFLLRTSNNRRFQSAGKTNQRSKCSCSNYYAVLYISFYIITEGQNVHDRRGFKCVWSDCILSINSIYSSLVEVQMKAGYIHATQAQKQPKCIQRNFISIIPEIQTLLLISCTNKNIWLFGIRFQGPTFFNSLNRNINGATTITLFKSRLKTFLLSWFTTCK